jgi:DNA modification methylase
MEVLKVKISEIKPNPKNPRLIKDEKFKKLVKSIKDFPQMLELRPIVVDENNIILGGNMRFKALKEAGHTEVSIVRANDLTAEQKDEFIVKDNVGFGEWDWDSLANEWEVDKLEEWGLDLPVDLSVQEELEAEEDEFEIPEGGIETDIVIGDLFEIGEHRLLCGDSTQTDTFEKLMQGELADMVVTDPPYNVAYEGKTKDALKIENDSMGNDDFYKFLYDFYTALTTAVKKGGAIYVWHASSEIINFAKAMVDAGWLLKQQLIWVKNSMVMGRQDYQWKHEPCLYGWLKGDSHKWYSDRKQTTIIEFDRPNRNAEHPTMKPIGLFAYQIENSSKIGDIVIDAFGGSGTAMIACEQLKRKARVIEYDPRYCQVILERMIKLDPTLKVKKNGEDYTLSI